MNLIRLCILCLALIPTSSSASAWTLQTNEDEIEDTTYSFIFAPPIDTTGFRWSHQAEIVFLMVDCSNYEVRLHTGTNALAESPMVTIRFDKNQKIEYEKNIFVVHKRQAGHYLSFRFKHGLDLIESMKKSDTMLIRYHEQDVGNMAIYQRLPLPPSYGTGTAMQLDALTNEFHDYNTITLKFSLAGFSNAYAELQSVCGQ